MTEADDRLRGLVAEVAAAYFSTSPVSPNEISHVINQIATGLSSVGSTSQGTVEVVNGTTEAVSPVAVKATPGQIRKSITPEALISFEDGRPYKTLKRHLSTRGLTVEQYRAKWGLPADYPSVSPNYSAARSQMAISLGLGQKRGRSVKQTIGSKSKA